MWMFDDVCRRKEQLPNWETLKINQKYVLYLCVCIHSRVHRRLYYYCVKTYIPLTRCVTALYHIISLPDINYSKAQDSDPRCCFLLGWADVHCVELSVWYLHFQWRILVFPCLSHKDFPWGVYPVFRQTQMMKFGRDLNWMNGHKVLD